MRSTFSRICVFLTCLLLIGCGGGKSEPSVANAQEPSGATQEKKTPIKPAPEEKAVGRKAAPKPRQNGPVDTGLDPHPAYPIPADLTPSELFNYIQQVAGLPPYGETDDEYISDQVARARSRLVAADRIILARGVDKNLTTAAVQAKLDSLKVLAILDTKGLGKHFKGFVDALLEGDSEEFKRLARLSKFWLEVDKMMYGQVADSKPLVKELKQLIEHKDASEAEFLAAQNGGYVLNERGYSGEATEMLNLIGKRFLKHKELGKEAKQLLEMTSFREKVIAAAGGKKEDIRTLFVAIRDQLRNKDNLNVATLDNTLNAAQVLEFNGSVEESKLVFQAIKRAFSKSGDEKLAKQAEVSVGFAEKRLGIIGKEIELEGSEIDGSAFNWANYKGKVVLVDFWASTSAPWISNLPSLKAAYDRFHGDGFEVVGINVDQNRDNAIDYLRRQRLPWPVLMDEVAPGLHANPNAIRYGIRAVPFVMLVGRDGKVADIHVRGTNLSKRVQELLAMPAEKNARNEKKPKDRK